jgi:hypothetical protein
LPQSLKLWGAIDSISGVDFFQSSHLLFYRGRDVIEHVSKLSKNFREETIDGIDTSL